MAIGPLKIRGDTAANWIDPGIGNDPVLAAREIGYDSTNNEFRVGDGTTVWSSLTPIGGGGSGSVATDTIWNALGDLAVATGSSTAGILSIGTAGQVLTVSGGTAVWSTVSGTGDVVGPASATDNAIVRYDGTTGKLTQNSAATVADTTGDITAGKFNGVTFTGTGTLATGTYTLTVAGTASVTGTNTGDQTNISGNAATVTTNANLTGHITSTGNAAILGSFTKAQLDTAVSDGDVMYVGYAPTAHTHAISTDITGLGTGVATALAVNVGSAGAVVALNGALGTPSSGTLTSCTGLPVSTGVSGLAANVATFLVTPSSANLLSALTDETGTGSAVFATSPNLVTPLLGTPTSGNLANCVGIKRMATVTIGDGTNVPTANTQTWVRIPFAATITKASIFADASGSAVVNVWKDTYANYPPTVADKITATAPPTLSTAIKNEDSTLTGWTTSIASGDVLLFNLDSVTTCKRITVCLEMTTA